ncbi:CoA-disulfide reductase [Clostridium tarantellae]|uniref:CoA-disulfide reductase n=1 Tax=Clostridium tarantellae TaxID=39493 RepID=A0A6I1MSH5_9CLOT|nr:CoA-disulfide reductase [Clostridium tarantellae]MPQ43841.1 CoA-disulfide reductase [Clostridium tarantellae]
MKYVVIGGIAAGMTMASKLKRLHKDAKIIVYEKSNYISFGACGLPYFIGGFFEDKNKMIARTVEQAEKNGIKVFLNSEVISCDFYNKKLTIKNINTLEIIEDNYDKLMIATGATPIIPNIKNINIKNVYTLRNMSDGIALKKSLKNLNNKKVGILGGGFIGVELLESLKKLNKEIHVFQLSNSILNNVFDKEITDIIKNYLLSENINLHLSTTILELKGNKKLEKVVTSKGNYPLDILIIATGVHPATEFLKNNNLNMFKNNALIIDEYGQTSIKDVYAAGDCATINHRILKEPIYLPLATGANKLGRIIAKNISSHYNEEKFPGTLGSASVKILNLQAATTGISEAQAKSYKFNYKTAFIEGVNHNDYYPGQSKIYLKLIYDEYTKAILGAQGIGKDGVIQRINLLATAIFNNMTTKELAMLDLSYSPPFSSTWDIINIIGNVAD